ncbi:hypothetical protein BJY01DRAFT_239903 [Aspergillus pseudoustus]|uniref:Fumarylacetoacetase-like C-terminal domain-containing protein n=1 Tax=Aspergillus pseudoustus TaxID=1810923 RepID=A0ABR4IX09_9EURO
MPLATHIIRFIAEDGNIYLGQPEDIRRDIGVDIFNGREVKAYLITGSIFDPELSDILHTVQYLLAPVSATDCNYIRCMGLNYRDHSAEVHKPPPSAPILFTKPGTAITDPFPAAIPIPRISQDGTADYEGELCVVIGKCGRDIREDEAMDHVLGFTASNDVSARRLQNLSSQWCFSKGLDGSCPLGPVLVTRDAISDPQDIRIRTLYNGDIVQDDSTSNMIFSIRRQIAYLSQGTTLEKGSIILTGTPAGIGSVRQPKIVLRDGDDIRVSIEGIGTLINRVRYE